jgi:A/G-specific adenine glycosylase
MISTTFFQEALLNWYAQHGRHDLPWQNQSPYHVWLSEIMLQQTQVATVLPYYHRFIKAFPSIEKLAAAPIDEILKSWEGLGYYHRARNLHKTAQMIVNEYAGQFPRDLNTLKKLPGIGDSTAAAILSQAFNLPFAILDGNVKRVLARFYGIETAIDDKQTLKELQNIANACMPKKACQAYTQAIMDMGATCCKPKKPSCHVCPLASQCLAHQRQLIDSIPLKAKSIKKKEQSFQFIAHLSPEQEIFLIQRPAKGIWPQLWCFPEGRCSHLIAQTTHELTHIRMNIEVYLDIKNNKTMNTNGIWVKACEMHQIALPKAIHALLTKIFLDVESPRPIPHQLDLN